MTDGTPQEEAALWLALFRDLGIDTVEPPALPEGPAPASAPESAESSTAEELAFLRDEEIGDCQRCGLHAGRKKVVFGAGHPNARLMFIGEGPGGEEDRQGEPFVGPAGQLLDRIIAAMGLERSDVYIANIVKCRPPGNRAPLPDEAASCLPFLERQVDIIRPEVIVTLGRTALEGLRGEPVRSITRARGQWFRYRGVPAIATFHPAYLLRNASAKRPVWEDMQEVMARLGLA